MKKQRTAGGAREAASAPEAGSGDKARKNKKKKRVAFARRVHERRSHGNAERARHRYRKWWVLKNVTFTLGTERPRRAPTLYVELRYRLLSCRSFKLLRNIRPEIGLNGRLSISFRWSLSYILQDTHACILVPGTRYYTYSSLTFLAHY